MIILNTTFHCLPGATTDVLEWLQTRPGCALFAIRTELPEESEGFALQQPFDTLEDAQRGADSLAAEIDRRFASRIGRDILFFSTYLEKL